MRTMLGSKRYYAIKGVGSFLIVVALIAGMAGCANRPALNAVEIWNWHDLHAVSSNMSASYVLMTDLDGNTDGYEELAGPAANGGKGWLPLGLGDEPSFTGVFEGQGYEISDLFINRPDEERVGLFSAITLLAVIRNVRVLNATVTGGSSVGGLVGDNWRTVSNCCFSGNVSGNVNVGGLVGGNKGNVCESYSTGSVTGGDQAGGLVGGNWAIVRDSYSTGSVSGETWVGGLVGVNADEGTVSDSYSTGNVTGQSWVGGLVGDNSRGAVSNSFWDIETSGQATSGGGTGKTTAEMKDIGTFSGAGWDMVGVADANTRNTTYIWNMVDTVTYPFLSWQPVS